MANRGRKKGPTSKKKALRVAQSRALGGTQAQAAKIAGVSEATVGRWERSEWWHQYAERASHVIDDEVVAFALKTVLDKLREGDGTMARWVLERRLSARYGPPLQRQHISGGPLPQETLRDMTDEQLERLAQGKPLDGS